MCYYLKNNCEIVYPGSIAYLEITRVVSGQFLRIENIRCSDTAKCDCKEPKKHHNLTKRELDYTLIPTCLAYLKSTGEANRV